MSDLPRTSSEILQRIKEVEAKGFDIHGVERSRLLEALSYDDAATYLRGVDRAEWEGSIVDTVSGVKKGIYDYLSFAWIKANGSRGVSIMRALRHFEGLLWLLGPEAHHVISYMQDEDFSFFGKPYLVKISEFVGFPWKDHDNDQWVNAMKDEPLTASVVMGT